MKSSTKWLLLLLLVLLVYVGWKWLGPGGEKAPADNRAEEPQLLLDRVWIDSKPDKYTDYVHAALFLDDIPMGIFQKGSAYHVILEIFEFKRNGKKVSLNFPQTEKSKRFHYKITACEELPPFDLCLTLNKNPWGGPKRYYSVRESEGDSFLTEIRASLEAKMGPLLYDARDCDPHR